MFLYVFLFRTIFDTKYKPTCLKQKSYDDAGDNDDNEDSDDDYDCNNIGYIC